MRHQKQGFFECFPTALAMILGKDKEEVLANFQALDPEHRDPREGGIRDMSGPAFRGIALKMIKQTLGPEAGAVFANASGHGGMWTWGENERRDKALPFPEQGEGMLLLIHINGYSRHAVAYSNGVIYDPSASGPIPYAEWRALKPYWVIEGVLKKQQVKGGD